MQVAPAQTDPAPGVSHLSRSASVTAWPTAHATIYAARTDLTEDVRMLASHPQLDLVEIMVRVWKRERDRARRARVRSCLLAAHDPGRRTLSISDLDTLRAVGNGEQPLDVVLDHQELWSMVCGPLYDEARTEIWVEESQDLKCPPVTRTSWEVACEVFGNWARKCVSGFYCPNGEGLEKLLAGHHESVAMGKRTPDERVEKAFVALEDTEIHEDLLRQLADECPGEYQKLKLPEPPTSIQPMTDGEKRFWDALYGRAVPGKALAKELDTSPDTVRGWKSRLVRSGHRVENRPGRGYFRPDAPPDDLSRE